MRVTTAFASPDVAPDELADLMWSTDPHLNGYMYGKMSTLHKLIKSEWSGAHGLFSHRQAFTASMDGKIAGLLIGHTEEEYAAHFAYSTVHQPAALEGAEATHMETALHWMDRLFPVPRQNSYYILELAVAPGAQGKGLAGQLFGMAMERARSRNCARICLDVSADNPATGFYRHLGFQTEVETRVPLLDEKHGIGRHLHMVKDLSNAPWQG